jgi:Lar family restriction alleviation protein
MDKTVVVPELKPCPFCGGDELHIETNSVQPDDFHDAYVVCEDCDAQGRHAMTLGGWLPSKDDAKAEAVIAWNSRSAAPAAPAQQDEREALTDDKLLRTFNSADSVIDGLHEVASFVMRNLWPKGDYEATVTLLRAVVDEQHRKIVALTAQDAQERDKVLEEAAQYWSNQGYHNTASKIREFAALTAAQPADTDLRLADKQEAVLAATGKAEQQTDPVGYIVNFTTRLAGVPVADKLFIWRKEEATKQVDSSLITSVVPVYEKKGVK